MGPATDSSAGGIYTLLIELTAPAAVDVGSLGTVELDEGQYAYTGSANGPGGFARVDRHREVARGERDVQQWHIDALLGLPSTSIVAVVRSPGLDAECSVAEAVDGERIEAFGASDCRCDSHLVHATDREALSESVWSAHQVAGDQSFTAEGNATAGD